MYKLLWSWFLNASFISIILISNNAPPNVQHLSTRSSWLLYIVHFTIFAILDTLMGNFGMCFRLLV